MKIRELLDYLWRKIENDELDGGEMPDLTLCEEEFRILLETYAFKKLEDERI